MSKLRIFLADDHALVREGLKMLVNAQPDMEVVGEAGDGVTAWQEIQKLQPDVAVMDISMPEMNGAQVTERLKVLCPAVKVVALSAHEDEMHVRQLLSAGAVGYVLKRTISQELARALRVVASGGTYLDPAVAGHVINSYARPLIDEQGKEALSTREHEVLLDVALGYTNKEIATRLHLSVKTIEGHKTRILEKLRLHSRAELVRYAMQKGWLNES